MSRAAWSILAFGLYLATGGGALLFAPDLVGRLLLLPPASGFWVRLSGMFFWILAYYCFRAARENETAFISWSVWPRSMTMVFMAVFVALGLAGPVVLFFGAVDALAALWTVLALRADGRTLSGAPRTRVGFLAGTLQAAQRQHAGDHDGR